MDHASYLKYLDPGFPLLQKLREKAPGTYFHSRLVAEIGFSVAREYKTINELVVYLGGLYHDIGKIAKPYAFAENQEVISTTDFDNQAILEHVEKGYQLAKSFHLPKVIIQIIRSHHGTSIAPHPDKDIKIRYAGKKPMTAEETLVMLADSIEAAVRSQQKKDLSRSDLRKIIDEVIQGKQRDRQLMHSPFQEEDFKTIQEDFVQVMDRVYHSRPER